MIAHTTHGRRHHRGWVFAFLASVLLLGLVPQQASAQDFGSRASAMSEQVGALEAQYLKPAILRARYKVETRFNNAKVAYFLQDYPRASLLFVGLVEDPEFQALSSYPEALFLLAESLEAQRNQVAARRYYERIIKMGPGPYYQKAVVNLLELSAESNNYEGIDELYNSLAADVKLSPAINYVRGKVLYRQKRYADAREFFEGARQSPDLGLRAEYYRGVTFAAEGELAQAREVFDGILADKKEAAAERDNLLDLTYLAAGRIAYEQEDYAHAVDYYQHLGRTSPYFDQMLYELTWAMVAQGKYLEASRVTDIFLFLSNPDPAFVPKIKLLKADLHLRLEEYDQASAAYDDVVNTFLPVRQELEEFVEDERDLEGFFHELVGAQLRGEKLDYMPTLVQQWVAENKDLNKAQITIEDLEQIRLNIAEADQALDEMGARLDGGTRIQSFPELAEGMRQADMLDRQIVALNQEMLQADYEEALGRMSEEQRAQWDALEQQRSALQERYDASSSIHGDGESRDEQISARFARMRRELDTVNIEIDSQAAEIDAIEQYIRDHSDEPLQESVQQKVDGLRREARAELGELRERQAELRRQVAVERQRAGQGDEATDLDRNIRSEYADILAQQHQLLAAAGGADTASAQQTLADAQRRLERFAAQMNEIVTERSQELSEDLSRERQMLSDLDQSAQELMGDSNVLTAQIAERGFMQVHKDFERIVMRGDIGLIDVAWQKKEDMTRQINQLFEDRTAELKTLQEAFEEVR